MSNPIEKKATEPIKIFLTTGEIVDGQEQFSGYDTLAIVFDLSRSEVNEFNNIKRATTFLIPPLICTVTQPFKIEYDNETLQGISLERLKKKGLLVGYSLTVGA